MAIQPLTAGALNPADARTQGFLAGHTLHQNEKLTQQGYFMLLDAIKAWPESISSPQGM